MSEHEPSNGESRHLFVPLWLRGIYDDTRELVKDCLKRVMGEL